MQRLTPTDDQRGATTVVVALLMVALIGCAALAIDVSATYADRQQLQIGADAAALAVAQDCARGDCQDYPATAQTFGSANLNDRQSTATVTTPDLTTRTGRVAVRNATTTQHWFAPVLGSTSTAQSVQAVAAWGAPSGGTAVLPLIFSWCEWNAQTGGGVPSGTTEYTITFPKTSNTTGCTGPSNQFVPGGFGWLAPTGARCAAATKIGDQATSSPGNTPPRVCSPDYLTTLQGKTVLLPLFVESGGSGNHAWYRVMGYAAFTITGYDFAGQYAANSPCSGDDRCIRGYFTKFATLDDGWQTDPAAPRLGANVVELVV